MRTWLSGLLQRRRRLAAASPDYQPSAYVHRLLDEFHRFVSTEYGSAALSRDDFLALFWRLNGSGLIRPTNRFVGDLWNLFMPDFRDRLDEYYKSQELQLTMTLLAYATQARLLSDNYLVPYGVFRERIPRRAAVLEVGAGIPHGFLSQVFDNGPEWCDGLTIVELDTIYSRFTRWCCDARAVRCRHVLAHAGQAPSIPTDVQYDFVFAKDVFEHIDDPVKTIREIVGVAKASALLALDLEDKGPVEYQHISPALAHLREEVQRAGFRASGASGNMTLFERGL
jgi:methyltransferase family protein